MGALHCGFEDGSERGGHTGAGTPTYDQRLAAAGESGSCTYQSPLSDGDRTGHLPKLYFDLICRLRLAKNAAPSVSAAAASHGKVRHAQGASPPACSLMSRGCSRSPPSAHYSSIRANSIRARCSQRYGHRG
jgi:hypothetical protein